ncbi:DUF5906 domain-containing protein [Xanthomonas hortorum pv. vitians]|uniref:DNA primase family protein n=1 Tax=Xanthomonas hortorum TaxID=56454 RepID=UPI0015D5ACA3|nr:DUF5906 domain-containing protein [Xanthomonas hortorum]MCE4342184.1 DUF5906 domain-containing protein [Xanthomonas hortorum pv. vitians]NMI20269.1 Replication protein E1 [Xanthomonas hortorum pv. vitians]
MSETNLDQDPSAVNPSNVSFLIEKHWEKNRADYTRNLKVEHRALDRHKQAKLNKGELRPESLDFLFASHLRLGLDGNLWASVRDESATQSTLVYRWNENHWSLVHRGLGDGLASDWLDANIPAKASDKLAASCWAYARTRLGQQSPLPQLEAKRAMVPCADAYLEITADGIQALAPKPRYGMTHALTIETGATPGQAYTPKSLPSDSLLGKFLAHALPDEGVRALVQEQCGMTLLPGSYQIAAWWFGAAGSGKSTLAEMVQGVHNKVARLDLGTLSDTFALEGILGSQLILVDEVECEKWKEGTFKTLVSGNGIAINRKHLSVLNYQSKAKWIISSNAAPFFRDKSGGVARRLSIVEWANVIPADDRIPDFSKKLLEEEGQLFLDWMLEGARRVVARGRFMADHELPEAAQAYKQAVIHGADSIAAWAHADRVQFGNAAGSDQWQSIKSIHARYVAWCEKKGFEPEEILSQRQFTRGLKTAGHLRGRPSNRRVEGEQLDCYLCCWNGEQTDAERAQEQELKWLEALTPEARQAEFEQAKAANDAQNVALAAAAERRDEQDFAEMPEAIQHLFGFTNTPYEQVQAERRADRERQAKNAAAWKAQDRRESEHRAQRKAEIEKKRASGQPG